MILFIHGNKMTNIAIIIFNKVIIAAKKTIDKKIQKTQIFIYKN